YLFEVGGRGKGFDQIKDLPDSYVAADGLEVGFGNKIPLWLFGSFVNSIYINLLTAWRFRAIIIM
ncbi:MAG: hypothetical protein IIT41_03990, partial [Oscillospiraceae bacterium]|nr:hypothetical protein [Oscillospiraceae bacterium]